MASSSLTPHTPYMRLLLLLALGAAWQASDEEEELQELCGRKRPPERQPRPLHTQEARYHRAPLALGLLHACFEGGSHSPFLSPTGSPACLPDGRRAAPAPFGEANLNLTVLRPSFPQRSPSTLPLPHLGEAAGALPSPLPYQVGNSQRNLIKQLKTQSPPLPRYRRPLKQPARPARRSSRPGGGTYSAPRRVVPRSAGREFQSGAARAARGGASRPQIGGAARTGLSLSRSAAAEEGWVSAARGPGRAGPNGAGVGAEAAGAPRGVGGCP